MNYLHAGVIFNTQVFQQICYRWILYPHYSIFIFPVLKYEVVSHPEISWRDRIFEHNLGSKQLSIFYLYPHMLYLKYLLYVTA